MSITQSKDGTIIAFDRSGEGSPIILVHPAFGHRAFNPEFAELAQLLSSRFTVFNYDRRGRGESGDTPPYSVEREVDDLAALIDAAGGSAYVYGMSSGAVLALEAKNRGLAITKLALYEPVFVVDDTRPPLPTDYVRRLTELVTSGRHGDAVGYFMVYGPGLPPEFVAQMRTQPVWPAFEALAPSLVYDATISADTMTGQPVTADQVACVTVPTLVIVGTMVPDWMRNGAQAVADALPNGRVTTIEGEFHRASPRLLAPTLTAFYENGGAPR